MKNLDALFDNKGELKMIPINELKRCEFNDFELEDIDDLKNSILSMGLLTPLSVIGPNNDGIYTILSGERRYTAINQIRSNNSEIFEEIPCIILENDNLPEPVQKLIIEISNVETRNFNKSMHYFKIVQLLRECNDADKTSKPLTKYGLAKKMAERLKKSDRYCRLIIQVFDEGSPKLVQAVEKDEIPIFEANEFRKMVDLENKNRTETGEEAISNEDIDKAIDDMRNGSKAKEAVKEHITKPENKTTYTIDDIDNIDIDDFDLPDPDDNLGSVSSTTFGNFDPNVDVDRKPKKSDASEKVTHNVFEWCNKLLEKDSLTDSEQDIVYLMSKIVDKFL